MSLIAALDEAIVSLDVAFALQSQTMPLAVLIAIGAVVIGIAAAGQVAVAMLASAVRLAGIDRCGAPRSEAAAREDRAEAAAGRFRRPSGARGARAPGRSARRPLA